MAKRTGKGRKKTTKATAKPAKKIKAKGLKAKTARRGDPKSALAKKTKPPRAKSSFRQILSVPAPAGRRRPPHRTVRPVPRPAPNLRFRSSAASIYDLNLDRTAANFQPLTPLTFLRRAALACPETTAIIHGKRRYSYAEFYARSRRFASALARSGLGRGDTVSVLLSNTPAMLEAHHGVPMAGCVLNALNTRLDAASIAFMLDHAEAKLFIADREFAACAAAALKLAKVTPRLIIYDDPEFPFSGEIGRVSDYEEFLSGGDPQFDWAMPDDEWDAISLNYTSGTTGIPKGVVCHHRGAALMGYSNTLTCRISERPVYLWTLPMFHCNGWCFPWTLALTAGTHVCLRWVRASDIYAAISEHRVTQLAGAPTVMAMLVNATSAEKRRFRSPRQFHPRRSPAAGSHADRDAAVRLRSHACLWPDGDIWAGHRQ